MFRIKYSSPWKRTEYTLGEILQLGRLTDRLRAKIPSKKQPFPHFTETCTVFSSKNLLVSPHATQESTRSTHVQREHVTREHKVDQVGRRERGI